jgi:hypothetical protein
MLKDIIILNLSKISLKSNLYASFFFVNFRGNNSSSILAHSTSDFIFYNTFNLENILSYGTFCY